MDLASLLPSWDLALRAERKSPNTIRAYVQGVGRFLSWCADTGRTEELTKAAAQAFLTELPSPASAVSARTALKGFVAWLVEEGELDADPLVGLKRPKQDHKVVPALDDKQLKLLVKACQGREFSDRRDDALVRLMLETGMRAGDVVGLQLADVDLPKGLLVVRRGKGGKGRVVPFGPQTAAAIDRYIRMRRTHRLAATNTLWLGARGKTFGYYGLSGALKIRAEMAGIPGFHLHLLRHTAATRWLRSGGSETGLMAVAGWSTRNMIDRYTGASASERAAAEARGLNLGDV
jgi:site-specific recombinase XerD